VFAQIAADALEIPMDRISGVHHGSTAYVSDGYGAYHSRSVVMGGSALLDATKNLHDLIRVTASKRYSCAPSDIKIFEDRIGAPGGRSATFADFAGLTAEGIFLNKKHTYTYGTHAAHVTVDAKIGQVEIVDYMTVVDCGRIINPMTVRGQVIGSLVQGLGGALLENLVYDDQGQLLIGSLADYLLPTASDFPNLRAIVTEMFPSPINPLGAKGAGEGGIISAGGIVANAVANALGAFGVEPRELPLTPQRIWEMVQSGRSSPGSVR
jgi:carbon-monoxide dehydrogenase large subunit